MKGTLLKLWLVLLVAIIYAILPPLSYWKNFEYEKKKNTLLVSAKACGCSCAEVREMLKVVRDGIETALLINKLQNIVPYVVL